MLNEILKANIKVWVNRELSGYMRECGSEYRAYMREDSVGKFAAVGDEELKEEVSDFITAVLIAREDN